MRHSLPLDGHFQTTLRAGVRKVTSPYGICVTRALRRVGCPIDRKRAIVKHDEPRTVTELFDASKCVFAALLSEAADTPWVAGRKKTCATLSLGVPQVLVVEFRLKPECPSQRTEQSAHRELPS